MYSPGVKLSPVSFGNVAHLVLAGVSLEDFWPSSFKGSLVYSLKRWPRELTSTLTTGLVVVEVGGTPRGARPH